MRWFRPGLLAVGLLPGCASIIDGDNQYVTVRTAPVGAACTVQRGGEELGQIASTPGTMLVQRSKDDLIVVCRKPGWEPALVRIEARFTLVTVGNVIFGGVPGAVVDALTGANFRYDDGRPIILMTPQAPGRQAPGSAFRG